MERFPVFIFDDPELGEYYGFPEFDGLPGMKIGRFHHLNEATLPHELSRDITAADEKVHPRSAFGFTCSHPYHTMVAETMFFLSFTPS